MPRIINTFASENPLAKAIGSLGKTMFGDQLTPQQIADVAAFVTQSTGG